MKILTLHHLAKFCEEQKFYSFNSKESGYTLTVSIPGIFEYEKDKSMQGLLFTKLKVCHTLLNRNGSYISEENMTKNMPSLKYRPVLAYIHQLDSGEYDFHGHDIEEYEDENGVIKYKYLERQVGSFTADDPYLEYDKDMDKTYVIATAVIPEEYTMAAEIIKKKKGTKVSCELCIEAFSYNAKEHYLDLEDFYFSGTTLLGKNKDGSEIEEGMLGSRLDIYDFSTEKNSIAAHVVENQKLIETLEKLNTTLSNFTIQNNQKGGTLVTKFEELLEKYGITAEDVTFEYEGMSDEELEAKFAEIFEGSSDDGTNEGGAAEPEPTSDGEGDEGATSDDDSSNDEFTEQNESIEPREYSITMSDGSVKTYELSLGDISSALNTLVNNTYSDTDNTWYFVNTYPDNSYVIMEDFWSGRAYKQSYTRDGDNFALSGDRVEVFANWLTKEEETSLAELRSNYSSIVSELNKFKAAEEKAKKDELLTSTDYSAINQTEEFKALINSHEELSFSELEAKCNEILLSYAKKGCLNFSANPNSNTKPQTNKVGLPVENTPVNNRYGTLKFD